MRATARRLLMHWRCWFRHQWSHEMALLEDCGPPRRKEVVLAWNQCERCAKSKLVFILR